MPDQSLRDAVDEMQRGLVDADLGGGLVKKRVARRGAGKRGGYRTLLASNRRDRWIFLLGFGKNSRDNIDHDEERGYRLLAGALLGAREHEIARWIDQGELLEVSGGQSASS